MQLYLDIDGVFLNKRGDLADGAEECLRWAVKRHEPYWISTRTRDGTLRGALRAFHSLLDEALVRSIRPIRWNTFKTESLPLDEADWLWIDNEILPTEKVALLRYRVMDRFVRVDVDRNPTALMDISLPGRH